MTTVPLRRRLLLLAVVGILPMAIMSGIGLFVLAQQQRAQIQRVGQELARAVAASVDAELDSAASVLESLATARTLDRGDLAGFHEDARRVRDTQPGWAAVMLIDPSGRSLVDSRFDYGVPLPPLAERESFERSVRTRAVTIGNLATGPQGDLIFPIRVPVLREGALRYILSAIVKPDDIRDVLNRQRGSGDWLTSIFDAHGRRVARSRAHEANLGGQAAASLQTLVAAGAKEGFGMTYTLEGERSYTLYSRLVPSGWLAALSIPASLVEGAIYRSLAVYGGGVALSIALGVVAALFVARSINRPIADLSEAARALGGGRAQGSSTTIREIRDVADELVKAAVERSRGEALREELLRKEREARETAEAADRTKDEFLAVVSHELRTPLNAVYGWARMLQAGQVRDEDLPRALDAIVRNANAQVQLIDDLLDVSRIATGKMRLDVRSMDLSAVIEEALDAVRPAMEAKALRVHKVLDPRAGPVTGDPARLQQVVWNLLINAAKFTPRGGRVQVDLQRVTSHVEISVSDTGQGIAPAVLPFVFDRFRQSDSSATRAHGGLGLGLALVKHLVELHGGTVAAQSDGEGMGATFIVSLPLSIAGSPSGTGGRAHPSALSAEALPGAVRLDGLRVLVVDDDPEALGLVEAILVEAGAIVRTCRTASDGFDTLQRWRPDVLVSDIEMPSEDGYSLIRKVRLLAPEAGGRIPAVALTAYGRLQDRMRSLGAGYSMHVPKPVDPGELMAIVASLAARAKK